MPAISFQQALEIPELIARAISESEKHRQAKLRACEWLLKKGYEPNKIFIEYPMQKIEGRKSFVDVIGKGKSITIIECGSCDPFKLKRIRSKFNRVFIWGLGRLKPTRVTRQFLSELHYPERWSG